jgi:hypothetical protein
VFGHFVSAAAVLCLLAAVRGLELWGRDGAGDGAGSQSGGCGRGWGCSGLAVWALLAVVGLAALLAPSATAYNWWRSREPSIW